MAQQTKTKIAVDVALFALSQVAIWYAFKYTLSSLDPSKAKREESKTKSRRALAKAGLKEDLLATLTLNEYEELIASEVIAPQDIETGFADIGGLDPIISSLREAVIYPLCMPEIFQSQSGLFSAPKGVLLYGPPGCGKSLMARALAKESGATFINLKISTLTDKWFGESNKLVAAVFSLAKKLRPTMIFIDEIDAFMRSRSFGQDHEVTGMMKAEFMSLWDGLSTTSDTGILLLGATNRPNDIDPAILRRMPKRFPIQLPDINQRRSILKLMLKDIEIEKRFDIDELAAMTSGLSGSDLKEACRNAAMVPVRECLAKLEAQGLTRTSAHQEIAATAADMKLRPLRLTDFADTLIRGSVVEESPLD